jgi:outer membrane protein W
MNEPGIGARVTLGGEHWVGDLTWTWYAKADDVNTIAGIEDDLQVIPTDLGIRYLFNTQGKFKPYLGAGITYFWNNINDGRISKELGGYAIFGFNLGRNNINFFGEAIYRYGTADVEYQSGGNVVTGNMDLGGFGGNIGVMWTF